MLFHLILLLKVKGIADPIPHNLSLQAEIKEGPRDPKNPYGFKVALLPQEPEGVKRDDSCVPNHPPVQEQSPLKKGKEIVALMSRMGEGYNSSTSSTLLSKGRARFGTRSARYSPYGSESYPLLTPDSRIEGVTLQEPLQAIVSCTPPPLAEQEPILNKKALQGVLQQEPLKASGEERFLQGSGSKLKSLFTICLHLIPAGPVVPIGQQSWLKKFFFSLKLTYRIIIFIFLIYKIILKLLLLCTFFNLKFLFLFFFLPYILYFNEVIYLTLGFYLLLFNLYLLNLKNKKVCIVCPSSLTVPYRKRHSVLHLNSKNLPQDPIRDLASESLKARVLVPYPFYRLLCPVRTLVGWITGYPVLLHLWQSPYRVKGRKGFRKVDEYSFGDTLVWYSSKIKNLVKHSILVLKKNQVFEYVCFNIFNILKIFNIFNIYFFGLELLMYLNIYNYTPLCFINIRCAFNFNGSAGSPSSIALSTSNAAERLLEVGTLEGNGDGALTEEGEVVIENNKNTDTNIFNFNTLSLNEKYKYIELKYFNKAIEPNLPFLDWFVQLLTKTDGSQNNVDLTIEMNLNKIQKMEREAQLNSHSFSRVRPFLIHRTDNSSTQIPTIVPYKDTSYLYF